MNTNRDPGVVISVAVIALLTLFLVVRCQFGSPPAPTPSPSPEAYASHYTGMYIFGMQDATVKTECIGIKIETHSLSDAAFKRLAKSKLLLELGRG